MAADILIISLIASYCIFLIYKARKTQKREKRPGVPDAAETVVRVQACATSAGKTENKKM